jgi:hypothetical protein
LSQLLRRNRHFAHFYRLDVAFIASFTRPAYCEIAQRCPTVAAVAGFKIARYGRVRGASQATRAKNNKGPQPTLLDMP